MIRIARRPLLSGLAALGALSVVRPAAGKGPASPIVLELFTSQGCSSCPPADRLLGELAGEPDLLALAYHVDYWNYIGWTDPFSAPEMTERQRGYVRAMGLRSLYTPQLVIDGEADLVGSRAAEVRAEISRRRSKGRGREPVPLGLLAKEGKIEIAVGAAAGGAGDLRLVGYDARRVTEVKRGENAGRTLTEANMVRFHRRIDEWRGAATAFRLDMGSLPAPVDRLAVLLQAPGQGPILGATSIALGGA